MCKPEIRKKDQEERLTAKDLRKLVNSKQSKDITTEMLKMENKNVMAGTRDQFAKFSDNLLLHMLCKAAQRPGALANLTVDEFQNGQIDEMAKHPLYTTQTLYYWVMHKKFW